MKSIPDSLHVPERPWGILTILLLLLSVSVLAAFSPHSPDQIPQDPPREVHEDARTLPMPEKWKPIDPNWLLIPRLHWAVRVCGGILAVVLSAAVVVVIVRSNNAEECQLATFFVAYVIGLLFSAGLLCLTQWKIITLADVSPELHVDIDGDYPWYLRTLRPELVTLRTVCIAGIVANLVLGLIVAFRLRLFSSAASVQAGGTG